MPPAAEATGPLGAHRWKFDGQRGLVVVEGDTVWVYSRNGAHVSRTFPELGGIAAAVGGRSVVLDGEIVAVGPSGRPSFQRLQQRWPQQRRPTPELVRQVPVRMLAFDVLAVDGRDITSSTYEERRELLEGLMIVEKSKVLTVPRCWVDVRPSDMLDVAAANQVEGIVAKRLDYPYRAGRTTSWIKTPVRATAEFVIVGFWCAQGRGGRSSVGSLLLAGHDDSGELVVAGQVGTGLSSVTRRTLFELLQPIQQHTAPVAFPLEAKGIRWVIPKYVGEVAYREYVAGKWLRHASWKGLRDSDPRTVRMPPGGPTN
ncbi:DNA ligase [Mycobacterium heckeshornense]|uniref:ATP-dependent DNA ligase n=1 Tax=Mycobacterium heckeshornense TaxID=110505 RepID=UPI000662C375|nr:DNA ligase [Mycobacterium heckeshornense]KMV22092.1 DNA ligase [Mycobacterium heckeshornense]